MGATPQLYMVISELPPRSHERLRHLDQQLEPFSLTDATLAPGGISAWAAAFQMLWNAETLERVGWGRAPRFQIKPSVRRALTSYARPVAR